MASQSPGWGLPGLATALHLWHFIAPGFGVGFGAGFGVVSVGFGVGFGVCFGVGFGVVFGVGFGEGFGVGFGVDGRGPSCMLQLLELQRQIYTWIKYINFRIVSQHAL